jgi:prephenate dehydrogenase
MTDNRHRAFGTVGVVGLGLIGGSMARDLHGLGVRVLGYDRDRAALEAACADGAVDGAIDSSMTGLAAADAVIVAVPVSELPAVLGTIAAATGPRLITDVGSTKRSAIAAAESVGVGERFVGSHPMAGDHHSGWTATRTGMFAGATVYLCRTRRTRSEAFTLAEELWGALGARTQIIDAETHDERLAYASHLMHAAATALTLTLEEAGVSQAELGRGGRESTRLAGGSVDMWSAIALDNADNVTRAIRSLEMQLERLRVALAENDERAVRRILSAAGSRHIPAQRDHRIDS